MPTTRGVIGGRVVGGGVVGGTVVGGGVVGGRVVGGRVVCGGVVGGREVSSGIVGGGVAGGQVVGSRVVGGGVVDRRVVGGGVASTCAPVVISIPRDSSASISSVLKQRAIGVEATPSQSVVTRLQRDSFISTSAAPSSIVHPQRGSLVFKDCKNNRAMLSPTSLATASITPRNCEPLTKSSIIQTQHSEGLAPSLVVHRSQSTNQTPLRNPQSIIYPGQQLNPQMALSRVPYLVDDSDVIVTAEIDDEQVVANDEEVDNIQYYIQQ